MIIFFRNMRSTLSILTFTKFPQFLVFPPQSYSAMILSYCTVWMALSQVWLHLSALFLPTDLSCQIHRSLHGSLSPSQHSFPYDFRRSQGKLFKVKLRLCHPKGSRADPVNWSIFSRKSTQVSSHVNQESVTVSTATSRLCLPEFSFTAFLYLLSTVAQRLCCVFPVKSFCHHVVIY